MITNMEKETPLSKEVKLPRPLAAKIVAWMELLSGFGGISGGTWLILDPTGNGLAYLGYNTATTLSSIRKLLPINDFSLVGAFLLSAFGILPVLVARGLWNSKIWSWSSAVLLSAIEVVWAVAQPFLIGLAWVQLIWISLNLAIIILLSQRRVRAYLTGRSMKE